MKILIKGGRVVDPGQNLDELKDILIENGRVLDLVPPGGDQGFSAQAEIIDAAGLAAAPGFIDMHVHLREPGEEYKETIASGTAAAAAGGFTAVAAMPNTKPCADNRSVIEYVLSQAARHGSTRVYPVAALTVGRRGEELCEYGDLAEAGAVALSDDGAWTANPEIMRRALEYSRLFKLKVITHAEDKNLSGAGVMNEGPAASRLGLAGMPAAAEVAAVFRDIKLAELAGAPIHIAHVSAKGSVEVIRRAKEDGLPVTGEATPHHFSLTDEDVEDYRTEFKMNPPLRGRWDRDAIRYALTDGVLDAIATDHAPHSSLEKDVTFDQAAFGIIGLETALPLTLVLVRKGVLSLSRAVAALSLNPAAILGVPGGSLVRGGPADIVLIDERMKWTVDSSTGKSKSRNTPFEGRSMTGRAVLTILEGRITHNLLFR
ncbi:MAG: dihydroorotase [Pseudomonadota bacterium]